MNFLEIYSFYKAKLLDFLLLLFLLLINKSALLIRLISYSKSLFILNAFFELLFEFLELKNFLFCSFIITKFTLLGLNLVLWVVPDSLNSFYCILNFPCTAHKFYVFIKAKITRRKSPTTTTERHL